MDSNSNGQQLLNDLFQDPEKFEKTQFKGYELLNEYLGGFDIETLIPVLESKNSLIYKVGISICSELDEQDCGYLLPELLQLLEIEKNPIYLHYLFSGIFKGTYNFNKGQFAEIIKKLNSTEDPICISVMHLMIIANDGQLNESISNLTGVVNAIILVKGVTSLINSQNLNQESVIELIQNENRITQLFAGVIAAKLYDQYPDLLTVCAKSSNNTLGKFASEVLMLKSNRSI